jgi:hypothetical protein
MTSMIIDRIHAVSISASSEPVRIGDQVEPKLARSRTAHTLPAKLTARACLDFLAGIDPDFDNVRGKLEAGTAALTTDGVDDLLSYTNMSIEDRFLLKSALSENGLLPRGRRMAR